VFRSDGAILLTSGAFSGTTLATYTGAVSAQNTWFAFEIEVVINNTTGSMTVRKNGNTSNDFTLGSLNTRGGTANNYANRLTINQQVSINNQLLDDLLWRSDAASVPWVGDVRCYTRMPASDAAVQFSRNPATPTIITEAANSSTSIVVGTAYYSRSVTVPYDGTIGSLALQMSAGYTGNMKCTLFGSIAGRPGAVLGSAMTISNPITGANTFTFSTPVVVSKGQTVFVGVCSDTAAASALASFTGGNGFTNTGTYAAFPVANPATGAGNGPQATLTLTVGSNATLVNEAQQDGATSYVYDANVGDADFYGIAAAAGTPASVIGVTTRGFVQKSDAGTRSGAVQLKSGGTTVASPTTALASSWGWLYRTDQTDPATGAAWTPTGVSNVTVGPIVMS
jgi:hypothetical protein